VKSPAGGGTIFQITLPIVHNKVAPSLSDTQPNQSALQSNPRPQPPDIRADQPAGEAATETLP
jgi:hypothetical protein